MPEQNVEKLKGLIKDMECCMMTTLTRDQHNHEYIHSRPMITLLDDEGLSHQTLYFFSRKDTWKMKDMGHRHEMNLSYSNPSNSTFVSVSAVGHEERNTELMKRLWNPSLEKYFPQGLKDDDLRLIVCEIHKAEYWDSNQSQMVPLITHRVKSLSESKYQTENIGQDVDVKVQ